MLKHLTCYCLLTISPVEQTCPFTVVTNPSNRQFSTLTPETVTNSDGSVSLNVKVSGGNPAPNQFQWTLPGGATLSPGSSSGSFSASFPRVSNSLVLL